MFNFTAGVVALSATFGSRSSMSLRARRLASNETLGLVEQALLCSEAGADRGQGVAATRSLVALEIPEPLRSSITQVTRLFRRLPLSQEPRRPNVR